MMQLQKYLGLFFENSGCQAIIFDKVKNKDLTNKKKLILMTLCFHVPSKCMSDFWYKIVSI